MATPNIREGTAENFAGPVQENSRRGLVMVDCWSPAEDPSLDQREILARRAEVHAGQFLLVTVTTDREPSLSREYGVRGISSFKLFRHGKVVEEVRGMHSLADYRKTLERHLCSEGDQVRVAAAQAWQAGDTDLQPEAQRLLLTDDYVGCLDAVIGILRRDLRWNGARARRALLAVFDTLGADHEPVRPCRSELFRQVH